MEYEVNQFCAFTLDRKEQERKRIADERLAHLLALSLMRATVGAGGSEVTE
jgi:hypothetical protein